jgi:hypothetical protein
MATWDDVRRAVADLPDVAETTSNGQLGWRVKDKSFAWERPLRRGDFEAVGGNAPDGPILAAHVADLGVKEALVADNPGVYFTIPHFNGFRAILVRLDRIDNDELSELVTEAWLARAPKRLAKQYLEGVG